VGSINRSSSLRDTTPPHALGYNTHLAMRFAVVGDVHLSFGPADVAFLDAQGYDAVLFVGDFGGYAERGALRVARYVRTLTTRALVIPGNHDMAGAAQVVAEAFATQPACDLLGAGLRARVEQLRTALQPAELVGYSLHAIGDVALIAARPHSSGGPTLGCRRYLTEAFGVSSLDASVERLCSLIDDAKHERIVLLAHNGPSGLGDRRDAIWGADFRPSEGDFGDPDLERAITHARAKGKKVLAVIAGHMHHHLRIRGKRRWLEERDGTLYVNAARVPRVFKVEGALKRHVAEVTIDGDRASAREVLF
jgi:uncharacterized protein (TIGR04168 family)